MTRRRNLIAIVAGCGLTVVFATETSSAQQAEPPPGVQLGGSAAVLFILPSVGARLTVPVHRGFAVEGVGEYLPVTFDEDASSWFLFQVQMRQRLKAWRSWHTHATYGVTFFAKYKSREEVREPRPDGSVVVYPAHWRVDLVNPPGVHAGFGAERALTRSVVVRWDVQALVPVGRVSIPVARAAVGFAWHHGRVR